MDEASEDHTRTSAGSCPGLVMVQTPGPPQCGLLLLRPFPVGLMLTLTLTLTVVPAAGTQTSLGTIPKPNKLDRNKGSFRLARQTQF